MHWFSVPLTILYCSGGIGGHFILYCIVFTASIAVEWWHWWADPLVFNDQPWPHYKPTITMYMIMGTIIGIVLIIILIIMNRKYGAIFAIVGVPKMTLLVPETKI